MRALAAASLLILAAVLGGCGEKEAPKPNEPVPLEEEAKLGRFPLSQFYLEHDRFIAATDPKTLPATDARWLRDDDEVFGVVLAGQARAYPVPMISYHHVVNDVIQGIPVAITY